jgi:hypothetical protein
MSGGCHSPQPVPQRLLLDDPRVQVTAIRAGEPAPADGVWMNRYTFDALLTRASGE